MQLSSTSNHESRNTKITPIFQICRDFQLMNKDPERSIALFWAAIIAGDKVDSALKDMAIVLKQQNRSEEAIEAIISLRNRCSVHAQESLDNILLDLYKRCGRLEDQIKLLKHKLNLIHQGLAFNGKTTKRGRCQGKKVRVTLEHEVTRLLGHLGWAYMQQSNYIAAEAVYRKAIYQFLEIYFII
jgi:tetratricopeptide (TPR) repeat protein